MAPLSSSHSTRSEEKKASVKEEGRPSPPLASFQKGLKKRGRPRKSAAATASAKHEDAGNEEEGDNGYDTETMAADENEVDDGEDGDIVGVRKRRRRKKKAHAQSSILKEEILEEGKDKDNTNTNKKTEGDGSYLHLSRRQKKRMLQEEEQVAAAIIAGAAAIAATENILSAKRLPEEGGGNSHQNQQQQHQHHQHQHGHHHNPNHHHHHHHHQHHHHLRNGVVSGAKLANGGSVRKRRRKGKPQRAAGVCC